MEGGVGEGLECEVEVKGLRGVELRRGVFVTYCCRYHADIRATRVIGSWKCPNLCSIVRGRLAFRIGPTRGRVEN